MKLESDFRLPVDDSFNMAGMSFPCPSTGSFSSTPSLYAPFTPTSRRSTPTDIKLELDDGSCHPFPGSYPMEHSPSHGSMSSYVFVNPKAEAEGMAFNEALPTTPMKKFDGHAAGYDQILDNPMATQQNLGSFTPSNSFGIYNVSPPEAVSPTSFMMTPSHSMSGSEAGLADNSSWACNGVSPINFFGINNNMAPQGMGMVDMNNHSHPGMGDYTIQGPQSPMSLRSRRRMLDIQRKSSELQRAQIRQPRRHVEKGCVDPVTVVSRAAHDCDYPKCNKVFRRMEHLKRHKQTYVHLQAYNNETC